MKSVNNALPLGPSVNNSEVSAGHMPVSEAMGQQTVTPPTQPATEQSQ